MHYSPVGHNKLPIIWCHIQDQNIFYVHIQIYFKYALVYE